MSKAKILLNLKGRCNFVNDITAISGLDVGEGMTLLDELIAEGKVEKQMVTVGTDQFNRPIERPLFRSVPSNITEGLSLVE